MNEKQLADYFFKKVHNAKVARNQIEQEATQLLVKYPSELLLFAIRWARKYYPYSFKNLLFIEEHIDIIKSRFEVLELRKREERRRAEYDPKNRPQTKGPPEWIAKGIDYRIFE